MASCEQSKRRKTAKLRAETSAEILVYAAQMNLCANEKKDQAGFAKKVTETLQLAKAFLEGSTDHTSNFLSLSDASSMIIMEAQLSKKQCNVIRNYAKKIFPPYKRLQKEKSKCYPENIKITESEAEVPLQSILDHTVVKSLYPSNRLSLISKWGFDGSSSHTQYKQSFISEDDKYMFLTSFVPLRLICETNKNIVVWNNPHPPSPRYCRP